MKAYVLAAGFATRLYPLTRDVPKALLDVGGLPILSRVLDRVRGLDGLSEIVVVSNARFFDQFVKWRAREVARARRDAPPITLVNDGTTTNEGRLGANRDLQFALQRVPLGGEDAVVLASDHLFEFDLRDAQRAFQGWRRPTMLVRRVELAGGPSPYSEVELGADGRVLSLREKPDDPRTGLSAIAFYFFTPDDLALLDDYLESGNPDQPGHFLAWLVQRVPCYGTPLTGRWHDIGTPETLAEARAHFEWDAP